MRLTPPESRNIPEEELLRRLRAVVLWEAAFGMLNEMTPEEIEQFDEAVKRRSLSGRESTWHEWWWSVVRIWTW